MFVCSENMSRKISKLKHYKTPLLMLFSFLFGCMITINLTPIDKTCRIEDTDREYSIMKNSKLKNPEMVVLILSSPKNLHRRNIIRQTWVNLIESKSEDYQIKFKMKYYFVVGTYGLTVDDILHLSTEQSQFSDILLLPIHDSYQNLTLKVLKAFEWLNEQYEYGLVYKYVLKCDDDTFVRLDRLGDEVMRVESTYMIKDKTKLKKLDHNSAPFLTINVQINNSSNIDDLGLYWGYFHGNARIKSSGKWKETDWIACDKYVPYALGGGYILSRNLIKYIATNSDKFRLFNSEDISVGFWLSPITNVIRIHDARFDTEWTSRGCQNFHLITHNIQMEEMQELYNNIKESGELCKSQTVKRDFYLYNWALPPSQCCTVNQNVHK